MLSLRHELDRLRLFETREKGELAKAQVVLDLIDFQERLDARLKEITERKEKNKRIENSFEVVVGSDKHPSYAALLEIFKLKLKRTKKKNGEATLTLAARTWTPTTHPMTTMTMITGEGRRPDDERTIRCWSYARRAATGRKCW